MTSRLRRTRGTVNLLGNVPWGVRAPGGPHPLAEGPSLNVQRFEFPSRLGNVPFTVAKRFKFARRRTNVPIMVAQPIRAGRLVLKWGQRTYLMGVLNVTPDSFSGDGVTDTHAACARARELLAEGADILDVGGESTRPGAEPVPLEEELRRVIPVILRLVNELDAPISVDTKKAEVARQALRVGAAMINDVSALQADLLRPPRQAHARSRMLWYRTPNNGTESNLLRTGEKRE